MTVRRVSGDLGSFRVFELPLLLKLLPTLCHGSPYTNAVIVEDKRLVGTVIPLLLNFGSVLWAWVMRPFRPCRSGDGFGARWYLRGAFFSGVLMLAPVDPCWLAAASNNETNIDKLIKRTGVDEGQHT